MFHFTSKRLEICFLLTEKYNVWHMQSTSGVYKYNPNEAQSACETKGGRLAWLNELEIAQQQGQFSFGFLLDALLKI